MPNSSFFTKQKRNNFRSLHYQPANLQDKNKQKQLTISGINKPFKPQFLYFTHRQRQNIKFFDNQFNLKSINQGNGKLGQNFRANFHKKFTITTKCFDIKKYSEHKNSRNLLRPPDLVIQGKSKPTLKKKMFLYKKQLPCVGMYDAKPQILMKKLSRNQTFRKGRSCHTLGQEKQNLDNFFVKNKTQEENHFKNDLKDKRKMRKNLKKGTLISLIGNFADENMNKTQEPISNKLRIRCFDMSRQTSRFPQKSENNKQEQADINSEYIQKNYKRNILMPIVFNQAQLQTAYSKKKEEYQIQETWGILKHIKLKDFIKTHRKQTIIEEQPFQ